ncbi:MAG: hypothetical protein KBH93_03855 [Anaerolineae bacterium]|nr:hypothetical protein [Anaerolineae bacterium]
MTLERDNAADGWSAPWFSVLPAQAPQETRVEQSVAFLTANNIPSAAYVELSAALNTTDHQNVVAVLMKYGYSSEQCKAFVTDRNLLLLDSALNPEPSDALQLQALTLLQSYGLTGLDLQSLTPLANDPAAIMDSLVQKGLSSEQAAQLLEQLAALIQEGAAQGWMSYYAINAPLFKLLNNAGLPRTMLYDSAPLLNDPAAAAAYLTGVGFTAEQVQTFVNLIPELVERGVTSNVLEGWAIRSLIYRLEGMGLPPQSIYEVVSLGNIDVMRGYLIAKGLSGDVLELALVHSGGCVGNHGEALNPERLIAFQAEEASALLDSAGIAPTDLDIILGLLGSPMTLNTYLAETYGLDETQIAAFVTGLNQSTLAQTFDPKAAAALITRVEGG